MAELAADIAAKLGGEPHAVEQVLKRNLRRHLAEVSEVKAAIRQVGGLSRCSIHSTSGAATKRHFLSGPAITLR